MRTNSASSFLSSTPNLDEVLASNVTSSTASDAQAQYYKALQSYGKYFTMRLVQVLVQSRTNEKFNQPCIGIPTTPADWFNIKIDELGEVSAQLKKSISKFPPEIPEVTIDFFLYTVDQEVLPLESWSFSLEKKKDVNEGSSEVYHQLTTLLRSAMVAARMTPMHRYYVKKQSADTFVILYKIIAGSSGIDLGPDAKSVTLGALPGSFRLNLSYRTRMVIDRSPVQADTTTDSFQKINVFTPGSTPDSAHVAADSPISFDAMSGISTSPPGCSPISSPPDNDVDLCKMPPNFKAARSRSTSVASDGLPASSSVPKEIGFLNFSQTHPVVPKNMPFANLLTMSYTGTLFPVHEHKEEEIKEKSEEAPDSDSSTVVGNNIRSSMSASTSSDENAVYEENSQQPSELAHSQRTVVAEMSETVKPASPEASGMKDDDIFLSRESTDDRLESDDDSFVKIPVFLSGNSDSSVDAALSELISACKSPPQLESFGAENLLMIQSQLEQFSLSQGTFDRFAAEMRELVEKEDFD